MFLTFSAPSLRCRICRQLKFTRRGSLAGTAARILCFENQFCMGHPSVLAPAHSLSQQNLFRPQGGLKPGGGLSGLQGGLGIGSPPPGRQSGGWGGLPPPHFPHRL